jgi:hypothetical protein
VCLFVYYTCLLFILGVLGPWEFSLASRVIFIYFVCETPLCGVPGRYNFIRALSWSGRRDCTDFFLFPGFPFSGSVIAGTVQLNW